MWARRRAERGVGGEGDVGAEAEKVEVVVVGGEVKGDRPVRIAWPSKDGDGGGGGGGGGEAGANDEIVDYAGGGRAGAHSCADWACRRYDAGVEALGESIVGESAWVDLEVASDDERERARACVSADGGERGEVSFAEATARDKVNGVDDDGGPSTEVVFYGDGASWHGGAEVHRACGAFADEDAYSACGAEADAWEGAFNARSRMVAGGPGAAI